MRQIYGIDLSKNKFDVCFIDGDDSSESYTVVKNNFSGIVDFLENLPQNALLCCEHTGVYGDLLLFLADQANVPIVFVAGYEVRHSSGLKKSKTDKIDAKMIREYAVRFNDKLKERKYRSENMTELRTLYRLRNLLVKERKMLMTYTKQTKKLPYSSIKTKQITEGVMENLNSAIKEAEKEMLNIIKSDMELYKSFNMITTMKGVGKITACDLIIKTGNFKEIDTARKAASYAGVCPFENSSGQRQKKPRVSNMADKELKTLLYLCSNVAVNHDPAIRLYFERKKLEGKPYFLIMNNIANKLLRTIYALVKNEEPYIPGHITYDPRLMKNSA